MDMEEKSKQNKPVFTLEEIIKMGEWQARMIEEETKKEAFDEGKQKGIRTLLHQLILTKYEVDASNWLSTLQSDQLEQATTLLLTTNSFEELQQVVKKTTS